MKYSAATNLVWKISALEAQNLKHREIEPIDLLLGLLKIVDIDLEKISIKKDGNKILEIKEEIKELRDIFELTGLVATKARRRIRKETAHQYHNSNYKDGVIHRSSFTKTAFKQAEKLLSDKELLVKPIHLLKSLLDNYNSEIVRILLLVNVPLMSLEAQLERNLESKISCSKDKTISPIKGQPRGSAQFLKYIRSAIGFLELNMFMDALVELDKIPNSEKQHEIAVRLRQDIIRKL